MSLTAFNRSRRIKQIQEMKPENIVSPTQEVEETVEEVKEETVVEETTTEEVNTEIEQPVESQEETVVEETITPSRRGRRRTN